MKCTLCNWDVVDPCVTADGEHHKPRGCDRLIVDHGTAYQLLPTIDPETDLPVMRRFALAEEVAEKFNLV